MAVAENSDRFSSSGRFGIDKVLSGEGENVARERLKGYEIVKEMLLAVFKLPTQVILLYAEALSKIIGTANHRARNPHCNNPNKHSTFKRH
jgi:hypothetical protein